MTASYQSPLLARIFYWTGCITLVLGGLVFLLSLIIRAAQNSTVNIFADLVFLLGVVSSGMIQLGIGQVIDLIGKIAYNTSALRESPSQAAAVFQKPITQNVIPMVRPAAPAENVKRFAKVKRYFYQVDGVSLGPVDETQLQRLVNEGKIDQDTYIRPEDGDDWQRLEDLASP